MPHKEKVLWVARIHALLFILGAYLIGGKFGLGLVLMIISMFTLIGIAIKEDW